MSRHSALYYARTIAFVTVLWSASIIALHQAIIYG